MLAHHRASPDLSVLRRRLGRATPHYKCIRLILENQQAMVAPQEEKPPGNKFVTFLILPCCAFLCGYTVLSAMVYPASIKPFWGTETQRSNITRQGTSKHNRTIWMNRTSVSDKKICTYVIFILIKILCCQTHFYLGIKVLDQHRGSIRLCSMYFIS